MMSTPSLLHHFEAPDDYLGSFGWLCGYSADYNFLDQAAERFTRQTTAQRAHHGQLALAVMLDPGHSAIALTDAPGVAHLVFKSVAKKPFALLHAKVAVLGFRHESDPERWLVRLIVSTGNWTVQTVEESLDLVSCIECTSEHLQHKPDWLGQNATDITAAWQMLSWLQGHFDTRILHAKNSHQPLSLTAQAMRWLDGWLARVSESVARNSSPRYFDNRRQSLLKQLVPLVSEHASNVKRNYLGMGSGFFEGSAGQGKLPSVLHKITSTLKDAGLLTMQPEVDVFVNPSACQAVAEGLSELQEAGYVVRAAGQNAEIFGTVISRSLHAKFIFSANCREGSSRCSSAWVYLGSGNLTGPGFANRMSTAGGNLEAGMLLSPERLYWPSDETITTGRVISDLLPVQWASDISSLEQVSAGEPMVEHDDGPVVAPLAWLNWQAAEKGGLLCAPEQTEIALTVLDINGDACVSPEVGVWQWLGSPVRVATVQWSVGDLSHAAVVPVLDESGRLAAMPLPELGLDEAWWQLANFPLSGVDEDKSQEEAEEPVGNRPPGVPPSDASVANYPIRRMMALIEQIAARQVDLHKLDWLAWCARLEQSLHQVAKDSVVDEFRAIGINPLSPLSESAFLPHYAEQASSPEGASYRALLSRVEASWGVASLCRFGEQQ